MFSLLLPFSKSQQRWNEEKVKKRVQEYEKGVLMVGEGGSSCDRSVKL